MRRIHVDFHNRAGTALIIPAPNDPLTIGEHVTVYDDDTSDYLARVIDISSSTVYLELTEH